MIYVTLPNTDLQVARIALGSAEFGAAIPVADAPRLLDEYVNRGGNFIDTAHVYSDWIPGTRSTSEKTIGQWMKSRGLRDQLVIATKGAHPPLDNMAQSRLAPADLMQDMSESRDYLQVDTIDLYWLHRDDTQVPVGEIVDALDEQVNAGTTRYAGVSNWTVARLQAALDYAAANQKHPFVANQPLWSLATPSMERHPDQTLVAMDANGMAFHRRTGMAAVAYSSQAHGLFSKLATSGWDAVREGDRRLYDNDINRARSGRVQELAHKYGVPVNDIVLAYIWSQPFVAVPIIGPRRVDHLVSSLAAVDLMLTPEELAYLEG